MGTFLINNFTILSNHVKNITESFLLQLLKFVSDAFVLVILFTFLSSFADLTIFDKSAYLIFIFSTI